ncbi:MAG TPA: T9SS type A sorting domain-containing protein, partial [Cytophaga sp.]|nr:T9SS type A sorting domain-containing protein [Cytophaga sp.]
IGMNMISAWSISVAPDPAAHIDADAESSYASSLAEIGSPGKSTRATVQRDPCFVANDAPIIALDVTTTTNYLDGGVAIAPSSPYTISGVNNDPTDPASTSGLNFTISDTETSFEDLIISVSSSNTNVVPTTNIVFTGNAGSGNLKITAAGVGYSTINISVSDGTNISHYIINYAASAASATPATTIWHTGMSDASEAISLDDTYYIVNDDELNILNVYDRSQSGLPVASYDYTTQLNLPDLSKPEVDLEAGTRSFKIANRIYWLGSMSNSKAPFNLQPNRNRLFATTVTGTGAATTFSFVGYYGDLRAQLITWGDAHNYNFTSSAAQGVDSKQVNGFAAEGMVFGPDSTTLYIGLRAPLASMTTRDKAIIAPVLNFEAWFNNGAPANNPTFGDPIELDLGGRGIRGVIRAKNGTYIIVAGSSGADATSAIFKWTGHAADAPILVTTSANAVLNMEGVMEVTNGTNLSTSKLQVISDGGDDVIYNDNNEAKDFAELSLRKFRSDVVSMVDLCMPVAADTTANVCDHFTWNGTTYTASATAVHVYTSQTGCDSTVTLHLTIRNSSSSTTNITQCNSYTWNGTTYTSSNTYTAHFTNRAGCDSTATLVLVITSCTDIEPGSSPLEFQLLPNPNNGLVKIILPENNEACRFVIYGITGEKIKDLAIEAKTTETQLDLQDLNPGAYIVTVTDTAGNRVIKRMIKN